MRPFLLSPAPSALLSLLCTSLLSLPLLATAQDLDNGLKIETTRPASCVRKSKNGDTLNVHYRGTLQTNGDEFDSSYGRGEPFSFTIGVHEVIKGWDLGMLDMCPGEARNLTIPPALGYGSRDMGNIPPNSVLIFQTELLSIEGVEKEPTPPTEPVGPATPVPPGVPIPPTQPDPPKNPQGSNSAAAHSGSDKGPKHDSDNSECKLLGRFAILIQGALGALALLSLVWKRLREKPRRPVLVWFFDVSKQLVGSLLLHFANLFLSLLSSGGLEIKNSIASVEPLKDEGPQHPNPCSFYLLNLGIDTTIGIPILVFFLRILHALFIRTPLANPPESLKSGNYGHPPSWRWWGKQALVYFLGLFAMKLCVFLLFQIFPWLGWVGDWALRWTEGKEWMQIVFVMLVFPLIMNIIQYWIIDSFIKDPAAQYDYASVEADGDGDDSAGEEEGLIGAEDSDEPSQPRHVRQIASQGGKVVADTEARTKEANPLPLPIDFESDEDEEHDRRRS